LEAAQNDEKIFISHGLKSIKYGLRFAIYLPFIFLVVHTDDHSDATQ